MSYKDIFRDEYNIKKSEQITLDLINSRIQNNSLKKSFSEDLVPIVGNVFSVNEYSIKDAILDIPLKLPNY